MPAVGDGEEPPAWQDQAVGPTVPLQHALPTHLTLDPSQMLAMRESFFMEPHLGAAQWGVAHGAPDPRVTRSLTAGGPAGAMGMEVDTAGPQGRGEAPGAPRVALPHAWRRSPSPLVTTPGRLEGRGRRGPAAAGGLEEGPEGGLGEEEQYEELGGSTPERRAIGSPLSHGGEGTSPGGPRGGARAGIDVPLSSHFVDAGLAMGHSFRASWGPNGQLVIPGGSLSSCQVAPACLSGLRE